MNNFLNIKIGFAIIVILLSLLGIFAIDRIDKIANQTQQIYNHPFKVTKAAITIDKNLISMHKYMKDVVLSQNNNELRVAIEKVNYFEIQILKEYQIIFKQYLGPPKDIEDSYKTFISWRPIRNKVISLVVKKNKEEAALITKTIGEEHVNLLNNKVKTLTTFAANKADEYYNNALNYKFFTKKVLILLLVVLIIISIIISIFTINNLKYSNELKDKYLKEVEKLSITDPLTNIYNKRYFDEIFEKELKTISRLDYSLVFMIFDIDHFKNYNDENGHLKGNETLIAITKEVYTQIRRSDDYMFRIGGEEFAILVKTKDIKSTNALCENIIKSVRDLNIPHKNNNNIGFATISMGVGVINPNTNLNSNEIFNIVDMLMYDSKNSGRNRVVIKEIS